MKALKEYIIEGSFFNADEYKDLDLDLTIKPNGPQLQKFLDKYGFKPVAKNEELVDAAKYTQIYPVKTGTKTKWILNKRYGADGYIKNSKEAEELLLNNKLDKKF